MCSIKKAPSNSMRNFNNQETDALAVHNNARAAKNIPPLQWDTKLTKDAMDYARVLAGKRYMEHSHGNDGENLFQQSFGDCTYADAVRAWLAEEPYYRGQKIPNGNFESYGHYTQCMWSSTTNVGMGWARTSDGMTFIVARYSPAGNMYGEKPW